MTNDAEAQEIHATVTDAGHSREPADGYQAQRPDGASDEEIIDPDAVVIAEAEEVPTVPDDDIAGPDDDEVLSPAVEESGSDPVAAAPAAATIPEAARPGVRPDTDMRAAAGMPADTGRHADTSVTADTNMVGDPDKVHEQWAAIQSTFVDDPRGSVAAAAEFVTETVAALVASAQERERGLRGEWDRDGVDTEGLRNALRSYRGLLDQLVRR
jgi:hypothetical protein